MRRLLHLGPLGALGVALLHCAADGTVTQEPLDGGAPVADGSTPADGNVLDAGSDGDSDVTDAGRCSLDRWCQIPLPDDELVLTAVWSFAPDDAIAASRHELLHWDGAQWTAVDAPEAEGLTSLWASSPNDLWGVAEWSYRLVHGTRSASGEVFTWSRIDYDPATSPSMEILRGTGTDELWVAGMSPFGDRVIQHGIITTGSNLDGGSSTTVAWTMVPINAPISPRSFWVTSGNELWVAGNGRDFAGAVARGLPSTTDPSGYSWTEVLNAPAGYEGMTGIWGGSAGDLWSVGSAGQFFRSTRSGDGGIGWVSVPSNANTPMRGIWGSGPNDVWVVGEDGAMRHWDGATWSISKLAVGGIPMWKNLASVHGGPGGDVWAVGSGVALHRAAGDTP
jgi:hypothetical protein